MKWIGVLAVLLVVAGCDIFSPAEPADPCPLPPEQHPEAWTTVPVRDSTGQVVLLSYVCTSKN